MPKQRKDFLSDIAKEKPENVFFSGEERKENSLVDHNLTQLQKFYAFIEKNDNKKSHVYVNGIVTKCLACQSG